MLLLPALPVPHEQKVRQLHSDRWPVHAGHLLSVGGESQHRRGGRKQRETPKMAFTNSIPAAPIVAAHKVTTADEQKLKLEKRAAWLELMISNSKTEPDAKRSFENDLADLREIQAHIVPESVIQERCERLSKLCKQHNIKTRDNRAEYRVKNAAAVAAEVAKQCGGVQ